MSIQTFERRIKRLEALARPVLRTILVIQEVGTDVYFFDGAPAGRADIDKLQSEGHTLIIREIPPGFCSL